MSTPLVQARTRARRLIEAWPSTRWSRRRPLLEISDRSGAIEFTLEDLETLMNWTSATEKLLGSLMANEERLSIALKLANAELRRLSASRSGR